MILEINIFCLTDFFLLFFSSHLRCLWVVFIQIIYDVDHTEPDGLFLQHLVFKTRWQFQKNLLHGKA